MNCLKCEYYTAPTEVKQVKCIACSKHEYAAHRYNCNELSNAGQTIESLDNHNPDYADDRDIVSQIRRDYKEPIRDAQTANADPERHPSRKLSELTGETVTDHAYERIISFIYALTSLNELALCLFFSTIKREEKSTFAARHGVSPTKINKLYWDLIAANPALSNFILMTNGTLEGTRGRKPGQRNKPKLTDQELPKSIADSDTGTFYQQMTMF